MMVGNSVQMKKKAAAEKEKTVVRLAPAGSDKYQEADQRQHKMKEK